MRIPRLTPAGTDNDPLVEVVPFKEVEAVARVEIVAGLGAWVFAALGEQAEIAVRDALGRGTEVERLEESSSLLRSIRLLNELMITGSRMSI